jgi:transcription elongation factor Elf1
MKQEKWWFGVEGPQPAEPTEGEDMDKKAMREETERLVREAMERKSLVIKQGNTRIEAKCGKCGAANRVSAEKGVTRVTFVCKECGQKQETL